MQSDWKSARHVRISPRHDSVHYVIASWTARHDLRMLIVLYANGSYNADA